MAEAKSRNHFSTRKTNCGGSAVVANQGLQGIAFFEATVCLTLLVLFVHLRRGQSRTLLPLVAVWLDQPDDFLIYRIRNVL